MDVVRSPEGGECTVKLRRRGVGRGRRGESAQKGPLTDSVRRPDRQKGALRQVRNVRLGFGSFCGGIAAAQTSNRRRSSL